MTRNQLEERTIGYVGASRRTVLRGIVGGTVAAAFLTAGWTVQAAQAQEATPATRPQEAEGPVKIVVLYGQPTDSVAFEEYFFGTHVALVLQMPYVQLFETGQGMSALDGGEPAFHRMGELYFATRADMEASLASPEGQEAFADVANFATGGVTATIVEDIIVPAVEDTATPTT